MLLFIPYTHPDYQSEQHFNTSHVTVYLYPNGIFVARIIISIHLMLLFIKDSASGTGEKLEFQYISCYCLSFKNPIQVAEIFVFQYISCYCLSCAQHEMCLDIPIFQYISCYCLSNCFSIIRLLFLISIHLMLLFI